MEKSGLKFTKILPLETVSYLLRKGPFNKEMPSLMKCGLCNLFIGNFFVTSKALNFCGSCALMNKAQKILSIAQVYSADDIEKLQK